MNSKVSLLLFLVMGLLVCVPFAVTAQVYKWVDENGKVHYSDKKPPPSEKENVEVVDESALEATNILESGEGGVDVERMRQDRLKRAKEREASEENRLAEQAKNFQSKNCYSQTEEIRRGNAGGGTRVVGTQQVKRCRVPIPANLKTYLEGYIYEGSQ